MNDESRSRIALGVVVAAAASIVAIVVFGVPARALLTFAAILICPLSMLFMHGGHSGHATNGGHAEHHRHMDHAAQATAGGSPEAIDRPRQSN